MITLKNIATNLSITQALRRQSAQILPRLTAAFTQFGYYEACHQRISHQGNVSTTGYQGLTRAQHSKYGSVMIKWELSRDSNYAASHLSHEINVLNSLHASRHPQHNPAIVAPLVLAYNHSRLQILNQNYQLTVLAMPYYTNGSLVNQLNIETCQPLAPEKKQQLIIQAAHLLDNLHKNGWLHNDIKPSNILLDNFLSNRADNGNTTPCLLFTDFALAERIENKSTSINAGTPAYLAPERWLGQGATQQSDIYAFGIMMYEILSGTRPFRIELDSNEPLKDWAIQHCQKPTPILPIEFQHYQPIINKVLAKRREKRYQNMAEVLEELERL